MNEEEKRQQLLELFNEQDRVLADRYKASRAKRIEEEENLKQKTIDMCRNMNTNRHAFLLFSWFVAFILIANNYWSWAIEHPEQFARFDPVLCRMLPDRCTPDGPWSIYKTPVIICISSFLGFILGGQYISLFDQEGGGKKQHGGAKELSKLSEFLSGYVSGYVGGTNIFTGLTNVNIPLISAESNESTESTEIIKAFKEVIDAAQKTELAATEEIDAIIIVNKHLKEKANNSLKKELKASTETEKTAAAEAKTAATTMCDTFVTLLEEFHTDLKEFTKENKQDLQNKTNQLANQLAGINYYMITGERLDLITKGGGRKTSRKRTKNKLFTRREFRRKEKKVLSKRNKNISKKSK